MNVEDFLDACYFRDLGRPVPRHRWVEDEAAMVQTNMLSGIG